MRRGRATFKFEVSLESHPAQRAREVCPSASGSVPLSFAAMNVRFAMILAFVLSLFVYVGFRLADSFGTPVTIILMGILFGGFLSYRKIHGLKNPSARRFLIGAVHLEMGFLSFLLTFIIARDLIFIPVGFVSPAISELAFSRSGTSIVIGLAIVSLFVGVAIANAGPWVLRVNVPIRDLPAELVGFTIAQLSDMHIGPTTAPELVERIVKTTMDLNPDMIALTGDIGDGPYIESRDAISHLSGLCMKPTFYVTGNHEYYWNGPEWIGGFEAIGLKPLLNQYDVIERGRARVFVIGTPDPTARMLGPKMVPDVALAVRTPASGVDALPASPLVLGSARTDVRILLAHQPGISGEALKAGIDLQLSGHTHAGQFFPWTLVVKRVHEFSKGLGRLGSLSVYVNPGTGSWGPQVRLGTKTEITLLTLVKES